MNDRFACLLHLKLHFGAFTKICSFIRRKGEMLEVMRLFDLAYFNTQKRAWWQGLLNQKRCSASAEVWVENIIVLVCLAAIENTMGWEDRAVKACSPVPEAGIRGQAELLSVTVSLQTADRPFSLPRTFLCAHSWSCRVVTKQATHVGLQSHRCDPFSLFPEGTIPICTAVLWQLSCAISFHEFESLPSVLQYFMDSQVHVCCGYHSI